jgi:hypothetical protein
MRRSLALAFLLTWGIAFTSVASEAPSFDRILKAITNYLQWAEYWQGHFAGEECYKALIGKEVNVTTYQTKVRLYSNDCDSSKQREIYEDLIYAYIDFTNVLFVLGGCPEKYTAGIVLGDAGACIPGKLVGGRLDSLTKENLQVLTVKTRIPGLEPLKLPRIEENLNNRLVIEAVKRSMPGPINNQTANKATKQHVEPWSVEKKKDDKRVLVGRFREVDPYLLVYFEGNNTIYKFEFPCFENTNDLSKCLSEVTRYRLDYPKGNDEEEYFKSLLDKLRASSIEVELE